jgi:tetratricopeptide (TPR) repeat protein
LLANVGEEIADIESMISQQWQWLMQQQRVELSLWNAFLSVLHYSYRAFEYPESILADNPEHSMAYLCMAQCYQAKGQEFYPQAFNSFQKAIEFDPEKNGCLWYEFGCFCRDAMRNRTEARKCFENSLNQKSNLLACVDLAELEVEDGNFNRAREVLQQGLSLVAKEQWEKLEPRIQAIQAQLGL